MFNNMLVRPLLFFSRDNHDFILSKNDCIIIPILTKSIILLCKSYNCIGTFKLQRVIFSVYSEHEFID